ncbi:MAG: GSCFA domain-containing protein [Desulfobacterales bacterium]|nr:GSCFA domain-containing protein [Desulfobacterales bacterium]
MPVKILDCSDAIKNLKENPYNKWPSFDEPDNRLWPYALPSIQKGFSFEPGDNVFTMGSCFARNIESRLIENGIHVPTRDFIQTQEGLAPGFLNLYSVASIYNELSWALDSNDIYDFDNNLIEIQPDGFVDIHLAHRVKIAPQTDVIQTRKSILTLTSSVRKAKVVLITLGLVESWWDRLTKKHLNVTPHKQVMRKYPNRFELHVLDYNEVLSYLEKSLCLIKQYAEESIRVVLTVSPVPLSRTFTEKDVSVANSYSKSLLRTVSEKIVQDHDFVDYYPSYESVLLSNPEMAWKSDRIHVKSEMVSVIIERMINEYLKKDNIKKSNQMPFENQADYHNDLSGGKRVNNVEQDSLWNEFVDDFQSERYIKAAKKAEELLYSKPDDPRLYFCLARKAWSDVSWIQCLEHLDKVDLGGKYKKMVLIMKAESQIEIGELDNSVKTIEELEKIVVKRNGQLQFLIARLNEKRGDIEKAAASYKLAVQCAPGNDRILKHYQRFCQKNNCSLSSIEN